MAFAESTRAIRRGKRPTPALAHSWRTNGAIWLLGDRYRRRHRRRRLWRAATGTMGGGDKPPTAVGAAVGMRKTTLASASKCDTVRTSSQVEGEETERKPLQIANLC